MKRTRLTASVNTYDMFGTTSIVEFPVYVDSNERLFVKVMGEYMSVYHPDLLRNNIRLIQR